MPQFIDLTGRKLGRWTVIKRNGTYKFGGAQWLCRCECGNEKTVKSQSLIRGHSRSCGCLNIDVHREICIHRSTHGLSKTRTYDIWSNMLSRCKNPKASGYHKYGAKGTRVCDRWLKFENFFEDMGECPSPAHTLDRKENALGYSPSNCRWSTMKEQQNNRTNNRRLTLNGRTQTLMQWSEETGLHYRTIGKRLDRLGWTVERALSEGAVIGRNQYS